jgi:hypothetical protein
VCRTHAPARRPLRWQIRVLMLPPPPLTLNRSSSARRYPGAISCCATRSRCIGGTCCSTPEISSRRPISAGGSSTAAWMPPSAPSAYSPGESRARRSVCEAPGPGLRASATSAAPASACSAQLCPCRIAPLKAKAAAARPTPLAMLLPRRTVHGLCARLKFVHHAPPEAWRWAWQGAKRMGVTRSLVPGSGCHATACWR